MSFLDGIQSILEVSWEHNIPFRKFALAHVECLITPPFGLQSDVKLKTSPLNIQSSLSQSQNYTANILHIFMKFCPFLLLRSIK